MRIVQFDALKEADLVIDTLYKGGDLNGKASEVLNKLLPGCSNSGGFRKVMRKDGSNLPAYVVLYTSMSELEWPDYLYEETGLFRYYGDNRTPGRPLLDTPRKGNILLEMVYEMLNGNDAAIRNIPPFLVFKKGSTGWDVQFLGLAAPGNPGIPLDKDLVSFWRTKDQERFQNYEAYFTILDTAEPISKQWLTALIYNHDNSLQYAPEAWKQFVKLGRNGIRPLKAKRFKTIPSRYDQLQSDNEGISCLKVIRNHYLNNPYGFENCAKSILELSDEHFQDFSLTRPWRDGGRDALGYYVIGVDSKANHPLRIDCAMEAKCYAENHSVGVREMSRLISRIKNRQFGILVTTSYVHEQAYREVVDDEHPILIVSASDIGSILRRNSISSLNVDSWLYSIDELDKRGTRSSL